jgi:hypothetical protein
LYSLLTIIECSTSPGGVIALIVLIPFGIIGVLLLVSRGNRQTTGVIPVTLDFLQILALYSKFELNWPAPVISKFLTAMSAFNVNFQLIGVECFVKRYASLCCFT